MINMSNPSLLKQQKEMQLSGCICSLFIAVFRRVEGHRRLAEEEQHCATEEDPK